MNSPLDSANGTIEFWLGEKKIFERQGYQFRETDFEGRGFSTASLAVFHKDLYGAFSTIYVEYDNLIVWEPENPLGLQLYPSDYDITQDIPVTMHGHSYQDFYKDLYCVSDFSGDIDYLYRDSTAVTTGGTISSPNHPIWYGKKCDYSAVVQANEGETITIDFDNWDVYAWDKVFIYDGDKNENCMIMVRGGESAPSGTYTTTGNKLSLVFRSVDWGTYSNTGWTIDFTINE
jgi:hypothetical protein